MTTTTTPQEGRERLAKILDREVEIAKDDLERALEQTRSRILDAQRAMQDGMGVAMTVSGQGMILGQEGSRIDEYAGLWMSAERRRVVMLDLYDEAYGTSDAEAAEREQAERVGDGADFGMFTMAGNAKVGEIVENASRVGNLAQAWDLALKALESLSESVPAMAEAMDTAVRDCVYEELTAIFATR